MCRDVLLRAAAATRTPPLDLMSLHGDRSVRVDEENRSVSRRLVCDDG